MSIREIAKLAGVSVATVSRVLNGKGGYSEETKKNVLRAVKDNDFILNTSAKALRTNRTKSIGVMVPDITNEFFSRIVRYIGLFFLQYGYSTYICDSNEDLEIEETYIAEMQSRNIDGIIYIQGRSQKGIQAKGWEIPIVYIDRAPEGADVIIESDNFSGGKMAAELLLKERRREILLLREMNEISTVIDRQFGFFSTLNDHGMWPRVYTVSRPDMELARRAILEVWSEGVSYDGIFATNDAMAVGAVSALRELGVSVPNDVSVVGFDGTRIVDIGFPEIRTIHQDMERMAEEACRALLYTLRTGESEKQRIVIPVSLSAFDRKEEPWVR